MSPNMEQWKEKYKFLKDIICHGQKHAIWSLTKLRWSFFSYCWDLSARGTGSFVTLILYMHSPKTHPSNHSASSRPGWHSHGHHGSPQRPYFPCVLGHHQHHMASPWQRLKECFTKVNMAACWARGGLEGGDGGLCGQV